MHNIFKVKVQRNRNTIPNQPKGGGLCVGGEWWVVVGTESSA